MNIYSHWDSLSLICLKRVPSRTPYHLFASNDWRTIFSCYTTAEPPNDKLQGDFDFVSYRRLE